MVYRIEKRQAVFEEEERTAHCTEISEIQLAFKERKRFICTEYQMSNP
jgi:hypothetical protein